jgi:hypothetical protein
LQQLLDDAKLKVQNITDAETKARDAQTVLTDLQTKHQADLTQANDVHT